MDFLKGLFTDAKGRPEPKLILGLPAFAAGLVVGALMLFGVVAERWGGWSVFMGFVSGLIVVTAKADDSLDRIAAAADREVSRLKGA